MKRNKGFTLIELLAVIVILAIIALIATPMILGVIETAKKGASESSALGYIDAVEKQTAIDLLSDKPLLDGTYDINNIEVSYKGEKIEEGTVEITNGEVKKSILKVNDYYVCYANNKTTSNKDKSKLTECNGMTLGEEVVLVGDPILDKAKTLVYDQNGTCKTDNTTYNYMGGCYIKGASSNNYVWYNGFMWRIMGINSDNTVRLITDENVTSLAYGAANTGLTYKENEGYIHDWLNEYFYSNLNSSKNIIKEGNYFCSESTNEIEITEGRTTCTSGNEVKTKIGILSLDEYLLANTSASYLNIGQTFWLLSAYNNTNAWRIRSNGNYDNYGVVNFHGIRPIINVESNSIVTSGEGTTSNFYVLGEDKKRNMTGMIDDIATSGEYVNLEGKIYRIVRKTNNGIKLILDGFYEETEGNVYTMSYGSNNTFSVDSGIGQKLNSNVITWLGLSNSEKIIETTYYQGNTFDYGNSYIESLKESNSVNSKVAIPQVGDILTSQSSTMLTNNYQVVSSNNNTTHYWTMNKYVSSSYGWYIDFGGSAFNYVLTNAFGIRPVITVKSELPINGGNGTWNNPYQI